jgi:hypothetical protein
MVERKTDQAAKLGYVSLVKGINQPTVDPGDCDCTDTCVSCATCDDTCTDTQERSPKTNNLRIITDTLNRDQQDNATQPVDKPCQTQNEKETIFGENL